MKAVALGLLAAIFSFVVVGGLLALLLQGFGNIGVGIALVAGGFSALKAFFASASRVFREQEFDAAFDELMPQRAAFESSDPQYPAGLGTLHSFWDDVMHGRFVFTPTGVRFLNDAGGLFNLHLAPDAFWLIWEDTVVLELNPSAPNGRSLRILDPDYATWGEYLEGRGVRWNQPATPN